MLLIGYFSSSLITFIGVTIFFLFYLEGINVSINVSVNVLRLNIFKIYVRISGLSSVFFGV